MVDSKLAYFKTEFYPEKIVLSIVLVPLNGQKFDAPIANVVSKMDQVANYARSELGVRNAPVGSKKADQGRQTGPPVKGKKVPNPMGKLLAGGADRAIKVLTDELARAKMEKNPAAVEKAKYQLSKAQETKKRFEDEKKSST